MKHLKKIAAAALAVMIVLAMNICNVVAEDYEIVITGGVSGYEYQAYRIFDLTTTVVNGELAYIYTIDYDSSYTSGTSTTSTCQFYDLVSAFISANPNCGMSLVEYSTSDTVTTYQVQTTSAFDESVTLFAAYLKAAIDASPSSYSTAATATAGTDALATATLIPSPNVAGYYFINTSLGSLARLNTVTSKITVAEKNTKPSTEKTVSDDTSSTGSGSAAVNVGDEVYYDVKVNVGEGIIAYDIIVTDTLTKGLTFNDDIVITDSNGVTWSLADGDYTESTSTGSNNETIIAITLKAGDSYKLSTLTNSTDYVLIEYSATLNENAVIQAGQVTTANDTSNTNEVYLTYGRDSDYETTPTEVKVYTYRIGFEKVDGSNTPLAGAVFKLTDSSDNTIYVAASTGSVSTNTYYIKSDSSSGSETITTDTDSGVIIISGLEPDTYTLTEITPPDGYNILNGDIIITIADDGSRTYSSTDGNVTSNGSYATIVNNKGTVLPSTGGMGTRIFYTLGGILVVGAGILLITKKRMKSDK